MTIEGERSNSFKAIADMLNGGSSDIPVACTTSGLIYLYDSVVESTAPAEGRFLARQVFIAGGVNSRVVGRPCAACRSNVSTDAWTEKAATCTYRPLGGPLHVPRLNKTTQEPASP